VTGKYRFIDAFRGFNNKQTNLWATNPRSPMYLAMMILMPVHILQRLAKHSWLLHCQIVNSCCQVCVHDRPTVGAVLHCGLVGHWTCLLVARCQLAVITAHRSWTQCLPLQKCRPVPCSAVRVLSWVMMQGGAVHSRASICVRSCSVEICDYECVVAGGRLLVCWWAFIPTSFALSWAACA
jgi:hypothetical protein